VKDEGNGLTGDQHREDLATATPWFFNFMHAGMSLLHSLFVPIALRSLFSRSLSVVKKTR
jgi:hypothetical protein